ncbi:carboxylesterase/lipase family protein [Novosphingobium terrae]|uniref:carboxylesterase/lipase family protein n=1 Tax=Novosphingobium terrae TaxID=2726189 RepID=UPI001F13510C|nr:carboxylesterase family protein [Novosphingobium terrae]
MKKAGLLLAAALLTGAADQTPDHVVATKSGLVQGAPSLRDPAITVFKGIPYAAPPVGDLRFRPPAPVAAWQGVRKAEHFGAICPQPREPFGPPPPAMSEDCLTLNVWSGAKQAGEKRPVLVWIYGGGFLNGSGSNPSFDGEGLAKKGVVVVTFNYRGGALGFLATPELSRESGHGSGNYGLLDDIAALRWVQANIGAFGGDPARVTIAGQSAGAGSVGFMALSPLARGLFQRAIQESHARTPRDPDLRFLSVSHRLLPKAEADGQDYAAQHGAHSLTELRAMPWEKLIEGSARVDQDVQTGSTARPPYFRPVIDGYVLPRNYSATMAARAQNNVLVVAGNNADETGAVPETAFAALRGAKSRPPAGNPQVNLTLADFQAYASSKFGPMAAEFLKLYPATTDDEAARASNDAAHDANRISTWLWASEWTKGTDKGVYTYFWTHAPPGPDAALRGAYHGAEINYALGTLYAVDRPWTAQDRAIADRMSSYWANIITHGDPNGPGLPLWPRYDGKRQAVMSLGDQWRMIPIATPQCVAFWTRFYATQDAW